MITTKVTKEQILEAAAQIFREKGFHAASMQDIAEAVNLQKASLYHHVSSKQEILVELLDIALDMLIERVEEVTKQAIPADEKLRKAMQTYLSMLSERRDLAAVLLLEHRSLEDEFRTRHIPRRDRFERLWRGIIEEGVKSGQFECENPRLAVKAVLGVANWTIMWFRPNGKLSAEDIAAQNAELLLGGLRTRA